MRKAISRAVYSFLEREREREREKRERERERERGEREREREREANKQIINDKPPPSSPIPREKKKSRCIVHSVFERTKIPYLEQEVAVVETAHHFRSLAVPEMRGKVMVANQ